MLILLRPLFMELVGQQTTYQRKLLFRSYHFSLLTLYLDMKYQKFVMIYCYKKVIIYTNLFFAGKYACQQVNLNIFTIHLVNRFLLHRCGLSINQG